MKNIKNWFREHKENIIAFFKKWVLFFVNPHFLICFLTGWLFTNGWSYILFAFGTYFQINWMIIVSTAYMSLLWAPFTPEKLITLFIALFLLKIFFPSDEKTLMVLKEEIEKAKKAIKKKKSKNKKQ